MALRLIFFLRIGGERTCGTGSGTATGQGEDIDDSHRVEEEAVIKVDDKDSSSAGRLDFDSA